MVLVGFIEMGFDVGIKIIFLICFGVLFFLCFVGEYVELLIKCIEEFDFKVYLVNIGWIGGFYGEGKCFDIFIICGVIIVILSGVLDNIDICYIDVLNLDVFVDVFGVNFELLILQNIWVDKDVYYECVKYLVELFNKNFEKYSEVFDEICNVGFKLD